MTVKEPKECVGCGKFISYAYFSTHQKNCKDFKSLPSKKILVENFKNTKHFRDKIDELNFKNNDLKKKLLEANETINKLKETVTNVTTNTNCNIQNNNITINCNNNYYVINCQTGEREGLDISKINYFGNESIDYINKNQSLDFILKDLYFNDDHPENKVISMAYPNCEWILILLSDKILRYRIQPESIHKLRDFIIKRVEEISNKEYCVEDKNRAIKTFLSELTNEINTKELKEHELPIWNRKQYMKSDRNTELVDFIKGNNYWNTVKV